MKKTKKIVRPKLSASANNKHAIKKAHKRTIKANRPIHKKILLHPVSVFFLMCASVFVIGLTYKALADSYVVTGKVPAPPLTQGAQITQPSDGATYSFSQVGLTGTCEYKSYINLYRNGLFVGVAYCLPDSSFGFVVELLEGANTFLAQAYNITDDIGPVTPTVTLTYNRPIPPPPSLPATSGSGTSTGQSSVGSSAPGGAVVPLLLSSDFKYKTFVSGYEYSWEINVAGGTPPYKVDVDWGDSQKTSYNDVNGPTIGISHRYKKPGYYPVKVTVTDKSGQKRFIQLAALIRKNGSPDIIQKEGLATGSTTKDGSGGLGGLFDLTASLTNAKEWLWLAAPSVGLVSLMAVSFWLGERQELAQLVAKSMSGSHHRTGRSGRGSHRKKP